MMSSLPPTNELIGLFVAIAVALAFVSYLMYAKARDTGMSPRRAYRLLAQLWGLVLGLLALLCATRAYIGTPLLEGSASEGIRSPAELSPAKWVALIVAIAAVATGMFAVRRIMQVLDPPARHAAPDATPPDETC